MVRKSKKSKDKRQMKRYECVVPIEGKSGSAFDNSQSVDVCKNGVGFVVNTYVPVNTKMAIELDLTPDGDDVLVVAQVKWIRPMPDSGSFRIGLCFKEIKSGSKSRIEKYFKNSKKIYLR